MKRYLLLFILCLSLGFTANAAWLPAIINTPSEQRITGGIICSATCIAILKRLYDSNTWSTTKTTTITNPEEGKESRTTTTVEKKKESYGLLANFLETYAYIVLFSEGHKLLTK